MFTYELTKESAIAHAEYCMRHNICLNYATIGNGGAGWGEDVPTEQLIEEMRSCSFRVVPDSEIAEDFPTVHTLNGDCVEFIYSDGTDNPLRLQCFLFDWE